MKKKSVMLTVLALVGSVVPNVSAQNDMGQPKFELLPIVVSATRSEKNTVDVPMTTTVISGDELKKMGSSNLHTALAMVTGINYKQFGPGGAHMGTMMSEVSMRGIKNGTLVMVNGNPINLRGKYYLDAIPPERIERVEVIKGGGSVLYGSEAMAGVINIITKTGSSSSITLGKGNFGQGTIDVDFGNDKMSFAVHQEKWGALDHLTELDDYRFANTPFNKRTSLHHSYRFNDHLTFAMDMEKSDAAYDYFFFKVKDTGAAKVGDQQQSRVYTSKHKLFQLNYDKDDVVAKVYFNTLDLEANGNNYFSSSDHTATAKKKMIYHTLEKNRSYGVDIQKTWHINDESNLILGGTYQNEFYDKNAFISDLEEYGRHNYAIYARWENNLTNGDTLVLSGRETWTAGAVKSQNYRNFSGAVQYIHPLTMNENVYANISQSFIMPTFAQMYGSSDRAVANPNLKPQHGINYEVGYKKDYNNHSYRVALYHMEISDNIKVNLDKAKDGTLRSYSYINSDFKNTGLEAEMSYQGMNGWSYRLGLNIQNPMTKESGKKAKKPYWDREFGRIQLSGGLTYDKGRWTSSFSLNYLGDRVGTPSSAHSIQVKPYLFSVWNTTYHVDENSDISLRIDNVFNREDNTSISGGYYRTTPINYLLSYRHMF